MDSKHTHAHRATSATEQRWDSCVTPDKCTANPTRQHAHGGVIIMEHCQCGANRAHESNAGQVNSGPWILKGA